MKLRSVIISALKYIGRRVDCKYRGPVINGAEPCVVWVDDELGEGDRPRLRLIRPYASFWPCRTQHIDYLILKGKGPRNFSYYLLTRWLWIPLPHRYVFEHWCVAGKDRDQVMREVEELLVHCDVPPEEDLSPPGIPGTQH